MQKYTQPLLVLSAKVYIVVLNYNGWSDTIECLESLAKLTFPHYQVIVVDNFSGNDSLTKIQEWANGHRSVQLDNDNPLKHLSNPPINKPVSYKVYSRDEAENGGDGDDKDALILIQSEANLGFAGGNNIALRYVLKKGDSDFIWLLNNDTVVEPASLSYLVQCFSDDEHGQIGIVGGKVRYYHNPEFIQCIAGAYYNKWLGYSRQIGNHQIDRGQFDGDTAQPDLIIGACMLIKTDFLKTVGLMNEEYFLYFEEQDWAERARRQGLTLGYTSQAIVYHKEGSTIGASQWKGTTLVSDFYSARSKLLFTERYYGKVVRFTVLLSFIATIINRLRRNQFDRVKMILSVMINPHKSQLKKICL